MMNWQPPPPPVVTTQTSGTSSTGYSCTICSKTYTTSFALSRHTKSLHDGLRHRCHLCEKTFSGKSNLEVHIRIHTGERPYSCDHCGKLFRSRDHLNRHSKTHNKDGDDSTKPKCELCNKTFSRNESLKRHLQAVHKQVPTPDQKPHKCGFCGKVFSLMYHFQEHLKTHPGLPPQLTTYQITFPSATSNLVTITTTTTPAPQNNPNSVVATTASGGNLSPIKTSTQNNSPSKQRKIVAQCHLCNKTFSRKESVKRHLQIVHEGEKKFKCFCGKAFTQKHHLQQHNKVHTGEKPHQCHICNQRFGDLTSLRTHHAQSHHTEDVKTFTLVEPITWCQLR